MNRNHSRPGRRNFMIAIGAGAGAAATVAAVSGAMVAQSKPAASGKRRGKGYEETAHVRNYYRTAKV